MLRIFDKAKQQYGGQVWTRDLASYLELRIGDSITISVNRRPEADHGVWVQDPRLHDKVIQIGRRLGLKTRTPTTGFGKPILFNGTGEIGKTIPRLSELIDDLVSLARASRQI